MILRGLEYQFNAFELFCIKRRELLKSFEQESDIVRAGHWKA